MSDTRTVPSASAVLLTLIMVTWRRLFRGRALWVSVLIASLPILLAVATQGDAVSGEINVVQFLVMALLPAMFIASSIGEEIEDRTTTYLWSRPIPRWTMVIGKLIALAPIAMLLNVAGLYLSYQAAGTDLRPVMLVAVGAGALATSVMSAGLATLVPKHGMALAIVYMVVFDIALGVIPASIQNISITRQVFLLAEPSADKPQPAITMAIIAGVWLAIALWRIRRLES